MLSINPDSATRTGEKPFKNYDFASPNEVYFAHVEKVVSRADSQGLLLNISPFWIGCCKEGCGVGAKVEMFASNGVAKTIKLGQ
jgi:hypothetical protein